MAADPRTVMHRVGALLDRAGVSGRDEPSLPEVERVLTDGYACTLDLEARRTHIARQATKLDFEIELLRALLEELRDYGAILRQIEKHEENGRKRENGSPRAEFSFPF